MFVSSRDAGVRRQNRTYSNNKTARSSKISLFSTFTLTTTSSSGGSNNTISQDSYNRSQHKHRRKRQHRSRRPEPSYHNPSVDVFDFLVEEKSQSDERLPEGGAEDSDDSEDEAERPEPDLVEHLDEAEPEGYYRSMSDSGISMASSASGHSPKKRLPVVIEEMPGQAEQHSGREIALIDPGGKWPPYSPQPYSEGFIPPPCPPPPPAVVYDVQPIYPYQPYPSYSTPPLPAEGNPGPLITIREPSQQLTKPKCFRTFNKVSTRLLLQMQDEIAELENELKSVDEENDLAEKLEDRPSAPARDRTNREADVYEELHFKLDNYYHFLEMMHKVDSISQPAVTSDLAKYHKWLESRIRQGPRVRQLVGNDLRRFSEGDKEKSEPARTFQPQYLAYCSLINAVIPLILMKIIRGVLNRLILLSLIVVAGSIAQDRMRTTISRDELTCTLVCICISAFAAIFL